MNWIKNIFGKAKQPPLLLTEPPPNKTGDCYTEELSDFIQNFVTEESLAPAVQLFTAKTDKADTGCGCGCGCADTDEELTILPNQSNQNGQLAQQSITEFHLLISGHEAWVNEVMNIMSSKKISEYNLAEVGKSLICCIGKWIDCNRSVLQDYPEYQRLDAEYHTLQEYTISMLELQQREHILDAAKFRKDKFRTQSQTVQRLMMDLASNVLSQNMKL